MRKIILIILIISLFVIVAGIAIMAYKLGGNGSNTKITYKIHNNMSDYQSIYKERGIYYDRLKQLDSPHYYIISIGEKNSGGYTINIQNVNIDDYGNVEVIVKETKPKSGETTTMAFTYPICMLELDKYANSIVVRNTEGEEFKNINF